MKKVYYTIESSNQNKVYYTIWKNTESYKKGIGSFGCYNVFTGFKRDVKRYCKDNKIRIRGGINGCFS